MNRYPFRVTLLLWLVLILTAWNILRVSTSLAWRNTLSEFSSQPVAGIITVSGIIWVVMGFVILWGIWQNKAWTLKLLLGAAAGYTVWYWCERLIWQAARPNWPFAVIVNIALLLFILFTTKSFSREAHERKIENRTIE